MNMMRVPDPNTVNWDAYPADESLSDINAIQNGELRAIAQSLIDEGYTITDPEFEQEFGTAMLGDGEYRSILLQV